MLTAQNIPSVADMDTSVPLGERDKARALAFNLFLLSGLFWGICAFFWAVMSVVIQRNGEPLSISRDESMVHEKLVKHDSASSSPTESFDARKRPVSESARGEEVELQSLLS
jgi:hypothetical protein